MYLSFTFPDISGPDDEDYPPPKMEQPKGDQHLTMHAIPVIDGSLIENEGTLARLINCKLSTMAGSDGFSVGLLNDY